MTMTIEELLQTPYWIVDILPKQVPRNSPGQYFAVAEYYWQETQLAALQDRHRDLILNLNCYRGLSLNEDPALNPPPEQIAEAVRQRCTFIRIGDAMLLSEPDDTHMTLFNPDADLLELVRVLAVGEGLYLWQPPT